MTADAWVEANNRYLDAELRALRHRLHALGTRAEHATQRLDALPVHAPRAGPLDWLRRWLSGAPEPIVHRAAAAVEPIEAASAEIDAEAVPALVALSRRLGLTEFERQTLLMCAAMEFDTGFGRLCARAQPEVARAGPTFALALAALDEPAWDAMSPERPLRYWQLIEISQPGSQPLITSAIKADERIVNYIKGLNYLDDRLAPLARRVPDEDGAGGLPPSHADIASAIARRIAQANDEGGPTPIFELLGAAPGSKLAIARQVAAELGLRLHRVAADALPGATADLETFVRLWQRETALLPIALYVDATELAEGATAHPLERLLARGGGLIFLDARASLTGLDRETASYEVAKPIPEEQRALWLAALGSDAAAQAALLTGQFDLDQPAIAAIAAQGAGAGDPATRGAALWTAALARVRPTLDQLVQPIVPRVGWDDIELPERERGQLREIAGQVRNRAAVYDDWRFRDRLSRGLGISVLFAGDSGTGKSMAAEALAGELSLLLYRIDLSSVVSKYIGETGKNLRKLFDAAEDGGAILFFDEADALFGKRSEVKDSHDRYANIEVNYLLQRMENYRGLAILTTNMKSAIDKAFLRRLRFIVNFPFPGAPERLAIWRKVFPPQVDIAALDFARLARFNLTGGSIHNIALNAAFAAVAANSALTMPIVLEAARGEFLKLDKPVGTDDFRWLESVEGAA